MLDTTTATTATTSSGMLLSASHLLSNNNLVTMESSSGSCAPSPAPAPRPTAKEFSPHTCLFCNRTSSSLSTNCHHMSLRHKLHIPDEEHLLVDPETLLRYLHLVIYDYNECLYCHTTWTSPHVVQQHMLSQGHCQVDFEAEDSEYHEFYNFDSTDSGPESESASEPGSEGDPTQERTQSPPAPLTLDMGAEETLRLPSGKLLQNRKAGARKAGRRRRVSPARSLDQPAESDPVTAGLTQDGTNPAGTATASSATDLQLLTPSTLNKQERRKRDFALQVASMRESDQSALAHLLPPQRRALMAAAQKQEAKADRDQQRFRAKMDGIGNLNVKARFVNDVPGGKSHKNRFLAT